jgi:quinol monooxygenase YgiN
MPVTVIATLHPRDGKQDAVVEAVAGIAARIHAESGCLKFTLHRSGRSRLMLVESWRDQQSLEAHSQSGAFTELTARLEELLSEPPDIKLASPVPVGREEQGSL